MGLDNYPLRRITDEELERAELRENVSAQHMLGTQTMALALVVPCERHPDGELIFGPFVTPEEVEEHKQRGLWTSAGTDTLFEEFERKPGRVLGMFGGTGWIRGKYYDGLISQIAEGYSLYGDEHGRVSPEDVKRIAELLDEHWANDRSVPSGYEYNDLDLMREYFRILADNDLALAAWS
jgi:hypothetical protein